MYHIQLSKSDTELFQTIGAKVDDGGEPDIFYLPQYFKVLGNDVYEVLTFDELPEDVKELTVPNAVLALPDGGKYIDLGILRNEVKRIKAMGLNTDGLFQYLADSFKRNK